MYGLLQATYTHICSRFRKFWSTLRALWEESAPFNLLKFNDFLENDQPKGHRILKSLAVIDRRDMFEEEEESGSGNQSVGKMPWEEYSLQGITPSILTVRYNAWLYRNETEAWAGLAVKIIEELEATMTVAHKLRTSWIYNWTNHRKSICFGVIFPFIVALMVAIWFSTIVWFLLDTGKDKDLKKLKYGGLPASVIVAAWGVGKSVISFVKPISSQVVDYMCLPDHSQKLGYHQQVIDDINFLRENLYYKCSLKWEVFAFIWCCITWSWDENYVPGTKIPKMPPACGNNLRIVVFVHDLDRCEENVILQILSAVNLVLATCEINVILGTANSMIQRELQRKHGSNNSNANIKSNEELAEKYLRTIVQLPLHLPDPSDSESSDFLKRQLGMGDSIHGYRYHAAETGIYNAHWRREANPKFEIVRSTPEKFKQDTHIAQQGLGQMEEQETIEESEATTETDETIDSEQPIDEGGAGDQQQREGSSSLMDDLLSITSTLRIPRYTPGERNAFRFLHTRCTRSRRLPGEWECLLAYHRLAWNILSLTSDDINRVEGWHVQLIAWIFVCWEWRDLITILIKNWNKLEVLRNWKALEGPSLREIVELYIDEKWPADKKSNNFRPDSATKKKDETTEEVVKTSGNLPEKYMTAIPSDEDTEGDDYLKKALRKLLNEQEEMREAQRKVQEEMREALRKVQEDMREVLIKVFKEEEEIRQMRDMLMAKKKVFKEEDNNGEERLVQLYTTVMDEESSVQRYTTAEQREEWFKLRDALCYYNVSMDGIQAFQKFRFYCQPGHLPWPLPSLTKYSSTF
ncbi:hypothetical protein SUGI_0444950 [Cryptomeria japonica]|nr:hypothetical protein SUGI_0444950 [Cryptomeria japonica]